MVFYFPGFEDYAGLQDDDDDDLPTPTMIKYPPESKLEHFCITLFGEKWHYYLRENKTLHAEVGCGRRVDHVEIVQRQIVFADVTDDLCEPCVEALRKAYPQRDLFVGVEQAAA